MNGIIQKVVSGEIKLSSIRMGFPTYSLSGAQFNVISFDISKDIEFYVALAAQGTTVNEFYYSLQKWKYIGVSQSFSKIDEYSEGPLSDVYLTRIEAYTRVWEDKVLVAGYSVNTDGRGFYSTPPVLIFA